MDLPAKKSVSIFDIDAYLGERGGTSFGEI